MLSSTSHPGVVFGVRLFSLTLRPFASHCHCTVPTSSAEENKNDVRERYILFLLPFQCSVLFFWQLVLTQPLLSFLSSASAERRWEKTMVRPIVLALLTPMLSMSSEGELLTSDVSSDSRSGLLERGRRAAAFDFEAIFFCGATPASGVRADRESRACILAGFVC